MYWDDAVVSRSSSVADWLEVAYGPPAVYVDAWFLWKSSVLWRDSFVIFFFQAEDGIRDGQGDRRARRRGRRHRTGHAADSGSRRIDRSGGQRAGQGHFAGPAEDSQ